MWALNIYLHHSSETIYHSAIDTLPHGHWVEFSMDLPWHKPMAISPLMGHSAKLWMWKYKNTYQAELKARIQFLNSILSLSSLQKCFTFLFQFPSTYFLLASAEIKFL